jgi:putative ATP-dependent endonuclease of the OLD family
MKIQALYLRRYRSAACTSLEKCGGLNVLIGKNNAGKSNLLAAVELLLGHLKGGSIAGSWKTTRPEEEFTDRIATRPLQIGITLDFPAELNSELRRQLAVDAPQIEKAVDQIADRNTISVIVSGALMPYTKTPFLFLSDAGIGDIDAGGEELSISGISLLSVKLDAAVELFQTHRDITQLRRQIDAIEEFASDRTRLEYTVRERPSGPSRTYFLDRLRPWPDLMGEVEQVVRSVESIDEATAGLRQLVTKKQQLATEMQKRESRNAISAFAGDIKTQPAYIEWLMKTIGAIKIIHFREEKQKIGTEEANIFVRMKVRRGGPEQLNAIQQIIRELLGVHVDAFQPDDREGRPEMDVDQFLAEANGAGIREALRIILDLELKHPNLALIEEPEVHLHPGLEHVVAGYLRSKSSEVQMFVTTHSTEFVDSVTFQNAYLVSKNAKKYTQTQLVEATEGALRIPTELGLRLSSVFMYDRLIFVEGPSDEAVFREFARKMNVDLTKRNIGFVHMLGVRNFAHYAAEATLDLLSRRQVRMWFITDRDERGDEDVKQMLRRLGERAKLHVLKSRELENCLLDDDAVIKFIEQKRKAGRLEFKKILKQDVASAFSAAADSLQDDVIRRHIEHQLLCPIFLHTRKNEGDVAVRLNKAADLIKERQAEIKTVTEATGAQIKGVWPQEKLRLAPGAAILERAIDRLGATFSKESGDSEVLASLISPSSIPAEIRSLIHEISAEDLERRVDQSAAAGVEG